MKIASIFWQVLRNAKQNILPVALCLGLLITTATAKTPVQGTSEGENSVTTNNNFKPYATFQKMWIDYNVLEEGVKGMRIHVAFKVYDMKDIPGYLALYFQYRDGTSIKDKNKKFYSTAGEVAAYEEITPGYNPSVYEDYDVFMPYDELDLPPGNYELQIDVSIIYKQGGLVSKLTEYNFDYNNPRSSTTTTTTTNTSTRSVTLGDTWVDYNVTRNGRRGMLVHITCNVLGMRAQSGYLAFYFQKKDNTWLYTTNTAYRSNERKGQVALYVAITPGYDNTKYDDETVFMPYDELGLSRGNHDLTMDIDLIEKNGDRIEHITFHDFWYEKK